MAMPHDHARSDRVAPCPTYTVPKSCPCHAGTARLTPLKWAKEFKEGPLEEGGYGNNLRVEGLKMVEGINIRNKEVEKHPTNILL